MINLIITLILASVGAYVYWDASGNRIGKCDRKGLTNLSAGAWGIGSGLLAVIFIPIYFISRKNLIEIAREDPTTSNLRPLKAGLIFIGTFTLGYYTLSVQ